jgi:hypothetical protein
VARSFDTYPKAIERKIRSNKLYLGRYKIIVKNSSNKEKGSKIYGDIINKPYYINKIKSFKWFKHMLKLIKKNGVLIPYFLLSIVLGIIIYIFISYIIIICRDMYSNYNFGMQRIKANHLKYLK